MKQIAVLALLVSLFSCNKKDLSTGPDPNEPRIISRDTVLAGNFWEFNIGQPASDIYSTVQAVKTQRQVKYLSIVNNIFTDILLLEERLDLYNVLFLDEISGTPDGIQLYFEYDRIKSIYTNNGDALGYWPITTQNVPTVKIGDSVSHVYDKLFVLSNTYPFNAKFQRMSLFSKDINKPYDAHMSQSAKWQMTAAVTDKRFWLVEFNFTSGVLVSIYTTLYEYD